VVVYERVDVSKEREKDGGIHSVYERVDVSKERERKMGVYIEVVCRMSSS